MVGLAQVKVELDRMIRDFSYARNRRLLQQSIAKWQNVACGLIKDKGAANCPLCQEYGKKDCEGCPVLSEVGRSLCQDTPYQDWQKPFIDSGAFSAYAREDGVFANDKRLSLSGRKKVKFAAWSEVAFLKEILRKLEADHERDHRNKEEGKRITKRY